MGKYVIECKETLFLVGYISDWYLALLNEGTVVLGTLAGKYVQELENNFPVKV